MAIPISWDLQVKGAETVKLQLRQINEAYRKGTIDAGAYKKQIGELSGKASELSEIERKQTIIWQAQHPVLGKVSRSLSSFASISTTTLTIMNSINLLATRQNTGLTALATSNATLSQAQRELNVARQRFGEDSIEYLNALDKVNIATQEQKNAVDALESSDRAYHLTLATVGAVIASTIIPQIINLIPIIKGLTTAQIALNLAAFANPYVLFAAAVVAASIGVLALFTAMNELVGGDDFGFVREHLGFLNPLIDTFKVVLDGAAKGTIDLVNALSELGSGLLGGIQSGINDITKAINDLIDAANSLDVLDILPDIPNIPYNPSSQYFDYNPSSPGYGQTGYGSIYGPSPDLSGYTPPGPTGGIFTGALTQQNTTPYGGLLNDKSSELQKLNSQISKLQSEFDAGKDVLTGDPYSGYTAGKGVSHIVAPLNSLKQQRDQLQDEVTFITQQTSPLGQLGYYNPTINGAIGGSGGNNPIRSGGGSYGPSQGYGGSASGYQGSNGKYYKDASTAAANGALRAAVGFEGVIDRPTLFYAGEAGAEHVKITPHGKDPGTKASMIVNVTVQGSVVSERELEKVIDDYIHGELQKRSFT